MSPHTKPPTKHDLGIATTTLVAFAWKGEIYLEHMSALAPDGAGVLTTAMPPEGTLLKLAFRLSTSRDPVRCQARVCGHHPVTPGGLEALQTGDDAQVQAMLQDAQTGESATRIFRLSDLEATPSKPPLAKQSPSQKAVRAVRQSEAPKGISLAFVDVGDEAHKRVEHHIKISRELHQQLLVRQGEVVSLAPDDRPTLSSYFDEGDLSKRALDW